MSAGPEAAGTNSTRDPPSRPRRRRRETPRCGICGLHLPLCICATLPRFDLPFRLILVQNGVEVDRPTNTGRMSLRMLADSVCVLYGRRGVPLDIAPLEDSALSYSLLFPRPEAETLTAEDLSPASGRHPALVVVDGTWAQASHMARRIAPLRRMRCVKLPPGPPGLWRIRRPRLPEQVCTLEAVIRAVAIAGHAAEAAAMYDAFAILHERMQSMRAGTGAPGRDTTAPACPPSCPP